MATTTTRKAATVSEKPKRIQRLRTKGAKLPSGCVCVTRPGKWGNPFKVGGWYMKGDPDGRRAGPLRMLFCQSYFQDRMDPRFTEIKTAEECVEWFRWYMAETKKDLSELRGKDLACWCEIGAACHADVLLELANE